MRKIDKNSCFDLKQLSLFVKDELSDFDLNNISKHLEDCEECSETVENVKSFYFVDAEEKMTEFSSSEKALTLITFKYILKEKFSFLRNKMGMALNALFGFKSNTGTNITISGGAKPILNFSTSATLAIVTMLFCVSILFSPISQELISSKEMAKEENSSEQLVHNSVIANYYKKERKNRQNQLIHVYDGTLNVGFGPLDNMVNVKKGGILANLN